MDMQGWPKEEPVLLQVMKIPNAKAASAPYELVLWDQACTGIFVRNEHARLMGFPCRREKLLVCTLGGDVKEIDGFIYNCHIKDIDGKTHSFVAHGMDEVTGKLGQPLTIQQIKMLFPHIKSDKEARMLIGSSSVDYLIGISKASWQPERVVKAKCWNGDGDFWIWENHIGNTGPYNY